MAKRYTPAEYLAYVKAWHYQPEESAKALADEHREWFSLIIAESSTPAEIEDAKEGLRLLDLLSQTSFGGVLFAGYWSQIKLVKERIAYVRPVEELAKRHIANKQTNKTNAIGLRKITQAMLDSMQARIDRGVTPWTAAMAEATAQSKLSDDPPSPRGLSKAYKAWKNNL